MTPSLVTIQYDDLISGKDLSHDVLEAFGQKGLGAIAIEGIPKFTELRERLLDEVFRFAHQPEGVKEKYEDEKSMYNVGWSFGKEKLGNKPDNSKGSYYANPLYDKPYSAELTEKYPWAGPENLWPTEEQPTFEVAFKELGTLQQSVALLLAKQIDSLVEREIPGYEKGTLFNILNVSRKCKGRGLHYFPMTENDNEDGSKDDWIGWHNDTGFLTTLTAAQFWNEDTGEKIKNPDPNGGLWVADRDGGEVKVALPADQLMIQAGECLQIVTGGLLVATPHCVRPSKAPSDENSYRISRTTFPCFVDCDVEYVLKPPAGRTIDDVFDKTMPSLVPPLSGRWQGEEITFADFLGKSFRQFYEWCIEGENKN